MKEEYKELREDVLDEEIVTSPPYWDILYRKRSADHKAIRNYSDSSMDFGNINDYSQFLLSLQKVFKKVNDATKPGRYCINNCN